MPFFRAAGRLPATLVHHTGSMIRFTTGQLGNLPPTDVDCLIELPDTRRIAGRFHGNPANPYVGGQLLVRWIKGWLQFGENAPIEVSEGPDFVLSIRITAAAVGTDPAILSKVLRGSRRLLRMSTARRRRAYETWERDPAVRALALAAWGTQCQVAACRVQRAFAPGVSSRLVDVHHLDAVSVGGSDSPLNLTVLCVAHHAAIHRTQSKLVATSLTGATVEIASTQVDLVRDARKMLGL